MLWGIINVYNIVPFLSLISLQPPHHCILRNRVQDKHSIYKYRTSSFTGKSSIDFHVVMEYLVSFMTNMNMCNFHHRQQLHIASRIGQIERQWGSRWQSIPPSVTKYLMTTVVKIMYCLFPSVALLFRNIILIYSYTCKTLSRRSVTSGLAKMLLNLVQYIPRNMHTVLLCFALLWLCNRS